MAKHQTQQQSNPSSGVRDSPGTTSSNDSPIRPSNAPSNSPGITTFGQNVRASDPATIQATDPETAPELHLAMALESHPATASELRHSDARMAPEFHSSSSRMATALCPLNFRNLDHICCAAWSEWAGLHTSFLKFDQTFMEMSIIKVCHPPTHTPDRSRTSEEDHLA